MSGTQLAKELRTAIKQGDVQKMVTLINFDKSRLEMTTVFGTWLHVAALFGQLEVAKRLVEMGSNINARGGIWDGTPLNAAASQGYYDVVNYLLDQGAVFDVSDSTRNPLFSAIYGGHTAIARLLIDRGIDAHVKYTGEYMQNMDALAFACELGRTDIVKLLLAMENK